MTLNDARQQLAGAPPLHVRSGTHAMQIVTGQLNLGGNDPFGNSISVTNYYLQRNGRLCIPIIGEFHYSRYPAQYWSDELRKIKAGGVEIVATYVFWIHVEETQGTFNWSGDRDLRAFVDLCAQHELQVIVRLGPFCHGECRNGGLPDWTYGQPYRVRSTDRRFLAHVQRLYAQIALQLDGLLYAQGGPVIGVQLDNEYMHAGAPWEVPYRQGSEWVPAGDEGPSYLRTLKEIAQSVGLHVPLYTCTAWLGSPVPEREFLPMQGGYAFRPWIPDPEYRQPPTHEFIFRNRHAEPVFEGPPTYEPTAYPYASCELGSGIQITYNHRPVVPAACVEAMAVVALGSGANVLGYYMYHGGSNPRGARGFLNEFTVPRLSYDFQAPLGEYGRPAASYASLRLIHYFLQRYGEELAPLETVLPDGAASIAPDDMSTVRWAARLLDGRGFLFTTNYQDHTDRLDQEGVRFTVESGTEVLTLPRTPGLTLHAGCSAILPVNRLLGDIRLVYATAQPVTSLDLDDQTVHVFFAPEGMRAEYAFDPSGFSAISADGGRIDVSADRAYVSVDPGTAGAICLTSSAGRQHRVVTLTRAQALRCWKQRCWGQERLLLTAAMVLPDGQRLQLLGNSPSVALSVFPPPAGGLTVAGAEVVEGRDGLFTTFAIRLPEAAVPLEVTEPRPGWAEVHVAGDALSSVREAVLLIDYVGDVGEAFIDGELVSDNFCNGTTWEIGLGRHAEALLTHNLLLHVTPLRSGASALRYVPTGMSVLAEARDEGIASFTRIRTEVEYEMLCTPLEE